MKDEIIQSLWQAKGELARGARHNVHELRRQLREKQEISQSQIVDRSGLRPAADASKMHRSDYATGGER